jgi:DNA-binding beta-propeller fold protein YncE
MFKIAGLPRLVFGGPVFYCDVRSIFIKKRFGRQTKLKTKVHFNKPVTNGVKRGTVDMVKKGNRRTALFFVWSFVFLGLWIPALVSAGQQGIAAQDLGGIKLDKSTLWSPGRLEVDGNGTLYAVDSYKNHIMKFDSQGRYIGDMPFPQVSAIAVAADGTLYVGSHKDYSVSIIKGGKLRGYLGKGAGAFLSIRDIAVDKSTGNIFVADNVGNAVRIFTASGKDLGTLSGVHLPISVKVVDNEIYVLDAPVLAGDLSTGARLSVFDKGFNLIGTLDENGPDQHMIRPTDLAVVNGNFYVSDASLNEVLVYDAQGIYLGALQSTTDEILAAVSVAASPDGRLYVSSSQTSSIHVFALNTKSAAGSSAVGHSGGQQ